LHKELEELHEDVFREEDDDWRRFRPLDFMVKRH
jgi:hypothetical protein